MQIWNGRILHRYWKRMTRRRLEPRALLSREIPLVLLADLFAELEIVMMDRTVLWPAISRPTSRLCLRVELQQAPCAVACSDFGQNVYN